jgi:synaptobrevin family protein YKT6
MKLLALFILHKEGDRKVKILQGEFNLDSFGYFESRSVRPLLVFSARTVAERTALGTRQSVEADQSADAMVHVYVRPDGLASVIVSNSEYPLRVAHTLLSKVMDDFTNLYPPSAWANMGEQTGEMASLGETLRKYQNPQDADPLMRLQKDLDDTKDILKNTLVNVLERGAKIDDLVERSSDLGFEAKAFYKTARKMNRCCTLF